MPNKLEEATGKAVGFAKEVKATFKGLTGVFKVLCEQHGEVSALLKRAASAEKVEKRLDLWGKIRQELIGIVHGAIWQNIRFNALEEMNVPVFLLHSGYFVPLGSYPWLF